MGKVIAIIPARYESTRFRGKVIADLLGKPLIQHVWEQVRQPSPQHMVQVSASSALGSVKGKKSGRRRTSMRSPNRLRAKATSVPLRSPKVMPSATLKPSSW